MENAIAEGRAFFGGDLQWRGRNGFGALDVPTVSRGLSR